MPWGPSAVGAVALVALLLVSGLGAATAPTTSRADRAPSPPDLAAATPLADASGQLASAEASLAAGAGPAALFGGGCATPGGALVFDPGRCLLKELGAARTGAGSGGWTLLGLPRLFLGGGLTYDAADGYVLEFGGATTNNATWKYLHGTWTNITASVGVSPPTRYYPSLTYDPSLGAAVLFGGFNVNVPSGGPSPYRNDTWEFKNGSWTNVTSHAGPAPPARWEAGLAYDANDSSLVLFGGTGPTSVIP
ncbi:MAG TPA: hypothetical protein VJQ43_01195, partial [Thermoplasmata archaeon]|nr:hypothetical protein [Thermoplasmata archaeon]